MGLPNIGIKHSFTLDIRGGAKRLVCPDTHVFHRFISIGTGRGG
jgi:hypothetical protein